MGWIKKGMIYNVSGKQEWAWSHVHKPTPFLINKTTLRIYFGVRDINNITRTTFIDVNPEEPHQINYIHCKPCLGIGKIGTFDDSGANVSSIVEYNGKLYMYYIYC